jgi:hypothetical protein
VCRFFVGFPSPYNMINNKGFVYMEYKENGSPNNSSNVTIKEKVLNTLVMITNYTSSFPTTFVSLGYLL